jgi:DNA polymerase-3 subunit alpha
MIDFENIDLECSKTWDLIGDGNTKGVFQLESRLGQSMSKKLKPQNIEQLAALISILRPGCLEAVRDGKSVSNHYIDKKNNKESVDYFHPALESVLSETFGEMVYQEQAMQICQKIAQFNLSEADMLRKAIGKKNPQEMSKIKSLFVQKTGDLNIVSEDEAEQIFGWIEKSQRYSFNKSHAVSYALNAYVSAYSKAHYPMEFFTSYLRFAKDKIDPMKEINELVNNALESGIRVMKPDFRKLNREFQLIDNKIYCGLTNIKGAGESVYNKIIQIVTVNNLKIEKLCMNEVLFLILDKINSTAAKNIISVGAFDYLNVSRKKLLFYLEIISGLSSREKEIIINNIDLQLSIIDILNNILPSVNKKRKENILSLIKAATSPAYNLDDNYEWIANTERQLLGVSITCSIIDGRDTEAANCDCNRLNRDKFLPKNILLAAEISTINVVKTKRGKTPGQDMAFIKVNDGTGSADVIVFPKEFESMKNMLFEGNTVMLSLEQSKNKDSVFAKKVWSI